MKKLLFTYLFLLSVSLFAQKPLEFNSIVKVEGVTKNDIYVQVNDWLATTFNSANDVIQMADKDAGKFIAKGQVNYSIGKMMYNCTDGALRFTIKVSVRDNKFRFILTQISHKSYGNSNCEFGTVTDAELFQIKGGGKKWRNKVWVDIKSKANDLHKNLLSSITDKVNKFNKDEDW
jgi:hypothetical protein